MADIRGDGRPRNIDYPMLAKALFVPDPATGQKLIPFLGAGVSISNSPPIPALPAPIYPDPAMVDRIAEDLKVTGQARHFLEMALLVACRMQAAQNAGMAEDWKDIAKRLRADRYPPSAGALTEALCEMQQYTTFQEVARRLRDTLASAGIRTCESEQIAALRLAARVSRVADPPDALSSVSSLFATRYQLWDELRAIIAPKKLPTPTHELLADAAQRHLRHRNYLIITTNYDRLLERTLTRRHIPFVVLSTRFLRDQESQIVDAAIVARYSRHVPGRLRLQLAHQEVRPDLFSLPSTPPLVVVYKIHGNLDPAATFDKEGVVITESDYIFMTARKAVPGSVIEMMKQRSFLFLGYSLGDWNVRSIFDDVRRTRGVPRFKDCAVMKRVRPFEEAFCGDKDITIYETDLNRYVAGVRAHA